MTAIPDVEQQADIPEAPSAPAAAERRFLRSRTNRVLAGVCGGIAEYYGSDATAVRLLTVLIAVFTGIFPLLFVYLVAAVVVAERAEDGTTPASSPAVGIGSPARGAGVVFGFLLIAIGVAALANEVLLVDWDVLWPIAFVVLGGGLIVLASRRNGRSMTTGEPINDVKEI
jgi:phage shock protein PspC (stress-responsive transcriptional regulator)